jgi:hypothetical protein
MALPRSAVSNLLAAFRTATAVDLIRQSVWGGAGTPRATATQVALVYPSAPSHTATIAMDRRPGLLPPRPGDTRPKILKLGRDSLFPLMLEPAPKCRSGYAAYLIMSAAPAVGFRRSE